MGIVYLITNTVNGKVYVGATTKSLKQRWLRHTKWARSGRKMRISQAIREFGPLSFTMEELAKANSRQELDDLEKAFILKFRANEEEFGYNQRFGGVGGKWSSEEKASMSHRLTGNSYNSKKTHCPKGHPYDDKNTYRDKRGGRYCRACRNASKQKLVKGLWKWGEKHTLRNL